MGCPLRLADSPALPGGEALIRYRGMRALSIRQPWAELILRGVKKIEYRSRPTRLIGERFYIYAAKGKTTERRSDGATKGPVWSRDLTLACRVGGRDAPPEFLLEMMEELLKRDLP